MQTFRNNFSALRSTCWFVGLLILLAGCQNSQTPAEQAPAAKLSQGPVDRLTLALMGDPEDEVSRMGLIALQGDSLPGVQKLLASNDPAVRLAGIEILEEIVAPGAIEMLIASLEDPDESVRLEVVEGLGTWQNAKATEPLLALYPNETDSQVKYEILTSLGAIGSIEAIPVLQAATKADDRYLRMWGMDALCTMRAPRATQRAIKLIQDPDRYVRLQVLQSCKNLIVQNTPTEELLETVLVADSFTEASLGRAILTEQMAGTYGAPNRAIVREVTRKRLGADDNIIAALLLAEVGDPAAIPRLLQSAADPDPQLRHNIAYRLGQLGDPATIPDLIVLLGDQSELVSGTAAGALQQWDNPSFPAAQTALQNYTGPKLPPPTGPRLPAE